MIALKSDLDGNTLPIKNKSNETVCTPEELVFFFRYCFSPKERKFKIILLTQLGCECRVHESCAINLDDFHKGSNYRKVDMLIQKKAKVITTEKGTKKMIGRNVIVAKEIPESIAAHLRAWIKDNWNWINENQGYIFPSSHMEKILYYTNPRIVTCFMSNKRKQLIKLFPDKTFGKIIGWRFYKNKTNMLRGKSPFYLWSTHLMKRFAGTYTYLLTKDPIFTKELLCHERFETTQKHYIDPARVMQNRDIEKVKKKLFDIKFYEGIKGENEDVPAVWEYDKHIKTLWKQ